jgi:HK97 family phage major capsid protein
MTEKTIKDLIEEQGAAWGEFKKTNDKRIDLLEKKHFAPADLTEKLDTINADITRISKEIGEVAKKASRPNASKASDLSAEQVEHKASVLEYLRQGEISGLHQLERKAMQTGSDPDGGFLVSAEMDGDIDRIASTVTSFRGLANVRTIGRSSYEKMVKTRGVSGGWIGETEDSAETNAPQYAKIEIFPYRMYAEPWVTNDMLEDSDYDLEADLTDEAGITFGEIEGESFITGTGVKSARGFLTETMVANASYAWGSLGYIAGGGAGTFTADSMISLQHALKRQYRPGAVFIMADTALSAARQLKDSSGSYYLWNPDPSAGPSGTFLGSSVEIDDYMPTPAANAYSIAYGNFRRGYTIVDRRGIAVIRDNVTKKGYTKFHFSKRVGGGVVNYEAIKILKLAAS